jgi:hypothetical protein
VPKKRYEFTRRTCYSSLVNTINKEDFIHRVIAGTMNTVSQTVIILSLLATYWCNGNSDSEIFQEESSHKSAYSNSKTVSRSSSYSVPGDVVSQPSVHYDGGKAGMLL